MRTSLSGLTLVASLSLLTACGGGGGSSSTPTPTPNVAPVANAGTAQTVNGGSLVTLNGTASSDADGSIASYAWSQTAGTSVTLSSISVSQPTFTAPATSGTLTFSLTVTDNRGTSSAASTVNVTVNGVAAGTVTGKINYVRIPFSATLRNGLDYTNPQNKPARGVTVNAVAAGTTTPVLATATTDANGNYSLTGIAATTSINIQVVAQMVKTGTLPNWNFTVRDLPVTMTAVPNPLPDIYTYTDGVAFTASGAAHDITIPSGFSTAASPTVTGTRASAPFAILDTVYQAVALVTSAKADASFPALVLDWGTNNLADDGTFYTFGPLQHIVLAGEVAADTDEFDQHVIAHEFGHYIERNFSRADNIGGSHGLGDKLDPRVAFGEGFGYAFSAMVLNDPVVRDSFTDTTGHTYGCPNDQCSSTFNVENNPPATPPATNDNYGCWCSESSVWSILWDVYDANQDANDTVNLGFVPIWNVLTTDQKNTPAFTTIFSFITALKAQNAGSATGIDALVGAQSITTAGMDAYGSTETHFPTTVFTNASSIAVLPIYTTMTVGGAPAVLRTINDAGPAVTGDSGNKLGDHRFIRFTTTAATRTITATSTNPNTPDVDFKVFRLVPPFQVAGTAENPPTTNPETLTLGTAASEYLIDVYDCANGCDTTEGTPGDYDLTVSIQ